jgi:hypothetical protein
VNALPNRAGFAVATAVFILVVVAALAMGTLFAATHELRSDSDAIHQARAVMAAEFGIEHAIATWDRRWNGAFARGFGKASTVATPDGADLTVTVARLADELFLVTSQARAGPARRDVGRVVRLDTTEPPVLAALTASVPLDLTAIGGIDGSDRSPVGWDCPPAGPALPPVIVADTSALLRFGHFAWDAIVDAANSRLSQHVVAVAPRFTDEECDTSDPTNWGEPTRSNGGACTGYFPIVYAASDLVIEAGRGQGLLLVDGDLTVQGGFEFFGVVLVRGALRGGPGGARITGTVSMAAQSSTEPALDGIAIDFSRCTARKALLGVAFPVPVVERSWYQGFEQQ